jgi:hypothetical protein
VLADAISRRLQCLELVENPAAGLHLAGFDELCLDSVDGHIDPLAELGPSLERNEIELRDVRAFSEESSSASAARAIATSWINSSALLSATP